MNTVTTIHTAAMRPFMATIMAASMVRTSMLTPTMNTKPTAIRTPVHPR